MERRYWGGGGGGTVLVDISARVLMMINATWAQQFNNRL